MKKIVNTCLLCLIISLVAAMPASADLLSIPGGVGGMPYYGGAYTGPIGAKLNDSPITGGIICVDFTTVTYVPNSGFNVYVSTLAPVNISNTKFYSETNALFRYEEAAWLFGQIASNPSQTGQIQFAIWRIFTPVASSGASAANVLIENDWMAAAAGINPANYNFSSIRIYTPTDTTSQEFISGTPTYVVPLPPASWLLGSGLFGLIAIRRGRLKK